LFSNEKFSANIYFGNSKYSAPKRRERINALRRRQPPKYFLSAAPKTHHFGLVRDLSETHQLKYTQNYFARARGYRRRRAKLTIQN
jgi:hypothetical protein